MEIRALLKMTGKAAEKIIENNTKKADRILSDQLRMRSVFISLNGLLINHFS